MIWGCAIFLVNNYEALPKRGDKGAYVENMAFRELLRTAKILTRSAFGARRTRKEVDFVVGDKAYEIKFNAVKNR